MGQELRLAARDYFSRETCLSGSVIIGRVDVVVCFEIVDPVNGIP